MHTHQAEAKAIFPDRRLVEAVSVDGVKFYINYDKLAICTGSQVGVERRVRVGGAKAAQRMQPATRTRLNMLPPSSRSARHARMAASHHTGQHVWHSWC
jgi:NADPH-dependent 2,4-dienoyl-CoA reductase/sulfur reductase-like enzyme